MNGSGTGVDMFAELRQPVPAHLSTDVTLLSTEAKPALKAEMLLVS